jgi:hypothetical protein
LGETGMSKYDMLKTVSEDFNALNNVLEMLNDGNKYPFLATTWYPDKMSVQLFGYLLDSGMELKRTKRDCKDYPTIYSIEIDGVEFFELSEEPFEIEEADEP